MLHDFGDFLQHGDAAHYVVTRHKGRVCGYRAGISTKTTFPNYNALRADFAANLNETIAENTRMLLVALTPADSVPVVTQADLRDVTDAKVEALRQWDRRLESIFSDYQTHPERIRSLRVNMEERLLLAFAGLINELRQEDLGIQRYVWRSRDDAKVRVRHAEHDNRVFRWDEPPEDGHPGQAYNCRCVAEPILPVAQNDLVLADFVSPTSSFLVELGSRATALTTLGAAALAALAASEELQEFTRFATQNRIERAAEILGVDLGSAEGLFAVLAHELVYEAVIIGSVASLPKTTDAARIAAQAAALFEMANPGTILKVSEGDLSAQIALGAFVEEAYAMFEAGRLRLLAGTLAEGWVEVFPELTDNERRLGQLPGFTPERIQNWLEIYTIEDLGLPNHTGTSVPVNSVGNVISTPISQFIDTGLVTAQSGDFETPAGNIILNHGDSGTGFVYIIGKGHTPEQIDDIISSPNPDLSGIIEGRGRLKNQDVIILTGTDGHWVKLDEQGRVFATSNRNLPLNDSENDPGEITRPLEPK